MSDLDLLKDVSLFSSLRQKSLESIANISTELRYKPGDLLFKEADKATSIVIVKTGLIRISKGDSDVEITTIGPGAALGELSYFDNGARSATATAVEASSVLRISFQHLTKLLDKDIDLVKDFYKSSAEYMAMRLRRTTDDLQFSKEFVAKHAKYF